MLTCHSFEPLLSLFANDDLDARETARVAAHVSHCERCRKEVEAYRQLARQMQSLPAPLVPDHALRGFSQEVMTNIAAPQTRYWTRVMSALRLFFQPRSRYAWATFATAVLVCALAIWYQPFEQGGKPAIKLAPLLQARAWDKLYYGLLQKETRALLLHEPVPAELVKTALTDLLKKGERDGRLQIGLRRLFTIVAGREPKSEEVYSSAKILGVITARGYRPAPRKRSRESDPDVLLREAQKLPTGAEVTLADLVKPKD